MQQLGFSVILLIPSVLCALLVIMVILVKKENKLLAQQLTETTISLDQVRKQLAALQEKHDKIKEFQNSLREAELTTKFQKPRLDSQNTHADGSAPEKYRYFQTLAQKDMSAEEIASVLAISIHEAQQLISLSKLAQGKGILP